MGGGVVVATPRCGPPTWLYLDSLRMLEAPAPGYKYLYNPKVVAVDVARNWIVERILGEPGLADCEWVLWLDADAEVHPGTLKRLLSWGMPVVGALCFTVGVPVVPTVYRGQAEGDTRWVRTDWVHEWILEHPQLQTHRAAMVEPRPEGALRVVDFTGFHCILVHRRVLERMERPWFRATYDKANGEDRYFCERAQEIGYEVFVDLSVVAGHVVGDRRSMGALDFCAWHAITDFSGGPDEQEEDAKV